MKKRFEIAVGARFGRLTVTKVNAGRDQHGKRLHVCVCDCGTERTYVQGNLGSGLSKSCGCLGIERMRSGISTTHGMSKTPEWLAHKNMLDRCYYEAHIGYHNYGERGIAVCKRWRGPGGFERFYADMGERPSPKHSLDRRNNDGNYTPSNCMWATKKEQSSNQRTNRRITFDGVTMTLSEWAAKMGGSKAALSRRIDNYQWPVAQALTTPFKKYRKRRS